jgi:hypothetical protein
MLTGRRRTTAELAATADPIACVPIMKPSIVEGQPIRRRGDWLCQEGPPGTSGRDGLAASTLGGIASSRSVVNGGDSVEPPDVRCEFHGLLVRPNSGLFA